MREHDEFGNAATHKKKVGGSVDYDHNGLCVKKVVNNVAANYMPNGKRIIHMTQESNDLHFFYDAENKPAMVRFNGVDYFYVYNLQGNVMALIDTNGAQAVEYYYDAWASR